MKYKKGKDYIGVGVGAVIFNKQGEFLLLKRGKASKNEIGLWGFPGGAVEFGETIAETIKREVKEELLINIKPLKLLTPINHIIKKEKQHWIAVPYICQLTSGKLKITEPDKCEDVGWFSIEEASRFKLSLVAREVLKEIRERYGELSDFF